jgi:hypothetical protein
MGLGAVGMIASLVSNIWRTNIVYGIAGTALKFASSLSILQVAYYTVIGCFFLPSLLFGRNDSPRRGQPYCPLQGKAQEHRRWTPPAEKIRSAIWANLYLY